MTTTIPGGLLVDHAELQPENPGADGDRVARDVGDELRPPEHVHHVDRIRDVPQARPAALAEDGRLGRVDRDHAVSATLQQACDLVAVPSGVRRAADDGDGLRHREDVADHVVGRVVEALVAHRSCLDARAG